MIVYIAGLEAISDDVIEAAEVDLGQASGEL